MSMRNLEREFKRFRGQPVEIISKGVRFCGIDVDSDEESVTLIDDKSRTVLVEFKHIEAVIEPRMRLHRLCSFDDCDCECEDGRGKGRDNKRECCEDEF